MPLTIPKVNDFEVTGRGEAKAWQAASWAPLARVGKGGATYATRAKVVYSATGLYFLVECEDRRLTATMTRDGDDIYNEDVVEVFLWPDESQPLYFEYEISPLGVELPILVPNQNGTFFGWLPWHYEGERQTRRATSVRGGPKASGAAVEGWTAEFFIPFALLKGLGNVPPASGTRWRGNIYRIDYDEKPASHWEWTPMDGPSFHNFRQFGVMVFE